MRVWIVPALVAASLSLSACKKKPAPKPAPPPEEEVVEEAVAEPARTPAGPLPIEISQAAAPDAVVSKNGVPVTMPITGTGAIDEVREGGLTVGIAGDRIDVAIRLTPEIQPPFVKGEQIALEYRPLPPPNARALDVVIRRGRGETARNVQFVRIRGYQPATRFLLDGQVQVEQVGNPKPAREGAGQTPYGLDVAVTVAGKRAVARPGDVIPISLREGAADLTIVSSLLRGGNPKPEDGQAPYVLVVEVVPSDRAPDPANPAGPTGQPMAPAAPAFR